MTPLITVTQLISLFLKNRLHMQLYKTKSNWRWRCRIVSVTWSRLKSSKRRSSVFGISVHLLLVEQDDWLRTVDWWTCASTKSQYNASAVAYSADWPGGHGRHGRSKVFINHGNTAISQQTTDSSRVIHRHVIVIYNLWFDNRPSLMMTVTFGWHLTYQLTTHDISCTIIINVINCTCWLHNPTTRLQQQSYTMHFVLHHLQTVTCQLKPGFHYPSWRPELTGDRFPLPVNNGRVDGRVFLLAELTGRQHGPSTRLVETRSRQHGPCWRVMETGHPSTRAVNSGSGNRALRNTNKHNSTQ